MDREDGSPGPDSDCDLGDLEILLLIAEVAFGLSLDDYLLSGGMKLIPAHKAQHILAIEAPHHPSGGAARETGDCGASVPEHSQR